MRSSPILERPLPSGRSLLSLVVLLGLTSCGGLEPVARYEPTTDPAKLYARLVLEDRAINLSTAVPYNTFQLRATPLDVSGAPMEGLPAPTFTSLDTTTVWVTPAGELQARGAALGVPVIAKVQTDGNVLHADTAYINVTTDPAPPRLDSLSIHPVPPDSAIWAFPGFYEEIMFLLIPYPSFVRPQPRALDVAGNPIDGLMIDIRSLDPTIADFRFYLQGVTFYHPGRVRMVARTTAYGVTKADTVVFTIKVPVAQLIDITTAPDGTPSFRPNEVTLSPYGLVFWRNKMGDSVDVTFEDPTLVGEAPAAICDYYLSNQVDYPDYYSPGPHCGMGNLVVGPAHQSTDPVSSIGLSLHWNTIVRQFPVPGVYRFHSTRTGATGQVVVMADPTGALP